MTQKPPAEWVAVDRLLPWDQNPRESNATPIAESIKRFGFSAPIVAWKKDEPRVIAGHTRLEAAKILDMGLVPVRFMPHLTSSMAKALALADNKLSELAAWDMDGLSEVLDSIKEEVSISGLGWTDEELAAMVMDDFNFSPVEDESPPLSDVQRYSCPSCGAEHTIDEFKK